MTTTNLFSQGVNQLSEADGRRRERKPAVSPKAPSVTVVIPTLNEEANLPYVLPRIPHWVQEVLLVDGNSTDNTVEIARALRPDVRILYQRGKGKGDALRTGFAEAKGEIIVSLDADGSTDPEEIPLFVAALRAGADYAKGSRFLQGGGTADMPVHRKLGNWGFVLMTRALFGCVYTDLCYGYNAFWKRVLPSLELDVDGFEVETLMNLRALEARLNIIEVPSFEYKRVFGQGYLKTIPDGLRVLKTILRESANQRRLTARLSAQPHLAVSRRFRERREVGTLPLRVNLEER